MSRDLGTQRIREALSLLRLRLEEVDYNDPMVVLAGPGWSLSVACPWRLDASARHLEELRDWRARRAEARRALPPAT
jgi:hypothetical protein